MSRLLSGGDALRDAIMRRIDTVQGEDGRMDKSEHAFRATNPGADGKRLSAPAFLKKLRI